MRNSDALAGLNRALMAIDVMLRSGKGHNGRLPEMAREARENAERVAKGMNRARQKDADGQGLPAPE